MKAFKYTLAFGMIFLLLSKNCAFTKEETKIATKYPDYSYEFVGKDRHENLNRRIYKFNMKVNDYFVRPVNILWASVMPKYGTDRLQNVYENIEFPIRFFGRVLQKDFKASKNELKPFATH